MNEHFSPIKETFAELIQNKRIQSGISIEQMVEDIQKHNIKISAKTYSRIEDSQFYPTLETFFIILKVLKCEVKIDSIKII